MGTIRYHMKEPAVRVLGPGVRYVLWTQGCRKRCPGCVAAESHALDGGKDISVQALAWEVILSDAEGLTISGGEPFLQAEALAELVRSVRKRRDMGVIVYTGYRMEELPALPGGPELLGQTDLLIDGEYLQRQDDRRGLRGSANQRVIPLTERYRALAGTLCSQPREREVFIHGIEVHEAGLPVNGLADKGEMPS